MTALFPRVLRIGTRGSKLAMAQTQSVADQLMAAHAGLVCELVPITTTGDRIQDRSLADAGGKGLFTKEIEDALLDGSIDCAVHSMKDMPTVLPDGLDIPCILPREDVRDAFFARDGLTLETLPAGSIVGTSSLRRQALVLARRPDVRVTVFRGNVDTRLQKLADGVVDATLLAVAGLKRLGKADIITAILDPADMLPAVAQGAIGVECATGNTAVRDLLAAVHCPVSMLRITAERAFLHDMDGSCRTPIAALLSVPDVNGQAAFDALVARPDGTKVFNTRIDTVIKTPDDAVTAGQTAAARIRAQMT